MAPNLESASHGDCTGRPTNHLKKFAEPTLPRRIPRFPLTSLLSEGRAARDAGSLG